MNFIRYTIACTLGALTLAALPVNADEIFIPAKGLQICGMAIPTDAETLAAKHFAEKFDKFTGTQPVIIWGKSETDTGPRIVIGTQAKMASVFRTRKWDGLIKSKDADTLNQSYVIDTDKQNRQTIYVAGYGKQTTPRGSLGLSYGLAELMRRLDVRDGIWGFRLPAKPLTGTPATPHRLLYTANFIDEAIDAGFDQAVLGQGFATSMYDRDNTGEYTNVLREQQEQRQLIELARRRGMEICQYILPPFVRPTILEKHLDLQGEGFYNQKPGHGGLCWSKTKARQMIKDFTRERMEHFGPVDVYAIWFYDPGGCFCKDCKANQAQNIFEQLSMVDDLAKTISPGARIEAVLWPTWCFHEYQTRGIPFTKEETETFVKDFLAKCKAKYGSGKLAVVDSCESSITNIYNGLVDPEVFMRNGFMYSVMGMPGELAYRFPPFKFKYLDTEMSIVRDQGVQTGTLYLAGWLTPSVYAFGDILYNKDADWRSAMQNYAHGIAKGEAYDLYLNLLSTLEEAAGITDYAQIDKKLAEAEELWRKVDASPLFYGDRDWLKGYMLAQRSYLEMARAKDEDTFAKLLADYKQKLGKLPEFAAYANALGPDLVVNGHLTNYWRGPAGDKSTIGLGIKPASGKAGKVDARTGDRVVE